MLLIYRCSGCTEEIYKLLCLKKLVGPSLKSIGPSSVSLQCLSWNVRSLNNKVDEVLEYATDNKICILFIQETWLTDSNNHTTACIKAHGFKVYHHHRPLTHGGGVAIIYRDDLKVVRYFHSTYNSFESVSAKLILPDGKGLLLSCVYRTGALGSFLEDFENFLGEIFINFKHFLICGDINLHLEKLSAHSTEFINIISSYGLYQWVNGATHKAGHTLDVVISSHNILTSNKVEIAYDSVEKFPSCDHFPLLFDLEPKGSRMDSKKLIKFRSLHKVQIITSFLPTCK